MALQAHHLPCGAFKTMGRFFIGYSNQASGGSHKASVGGLYLTRLYGPSASRG